MEAPKLFISYSWSSQEQEANVIQLATELRESGVDAILDKWDLKEGHDAIAFMEKMVNDPDIKKVLILCDKTYVEKANGRLGGVGTETQIISQEVYEKQDQNKFVVVVMERDERGKVYLPTYYKSRIYIDLSQPEKYSENFEKLIRWVFDQPLHVKPEIGKKPTFLDDEVILLNNSVPFKRVIDALQNGKPIALGALDEFLSNFAMEMEKFRIVDYSGEFDEIVIKSIEAFLPYRNQLIQLFFYICRYSPTEDFIQKLHRFFEKLIPYMFTPKNISHYREWDYDNFRFIIHELFLYSITTLIQHEQFELASLLLERPYYLERNTDYGNNPIINFDVFRQYTQSLEYRNKRLELRRLSLRADLLKQRSSGTGLEFIHIMQTDFLLFMRSSVGLMDGYWPWYPETLVYLGHFQKQFEIFARASSKKYFDKIKCLISINTPKDLEELLNNFQTNKRRLPMWEFESINPSALLDYNNLATKP
ncbi:MAG: TIR domain-containing protein [Ignavibacteria bacterium]|jgi:hypothetical protein|nr:TIR domain-containing protein [Ignavibacteria bacterium]MCU7502645.1 TIR domain-containing protein [Ignavibacteria bacterium]MCU7515152.1 TIR domain-containing protein [Ignavibacteria bacterium]